VAVQGAVSVAHFIRAHVAGVHEPAGGRHGVCEGKFLLGPVFLGCRNLQVVEIGCARKRVQSGTVI